MQTRQQLRTTFRDFLTDDCGGTHMEYMLIAAMVVVVGALVVLAVRKVGTASV
ncbi:MAG TPA: hypothetical protein VFT37_07880 [Telluria sp.]|nr:hypothetical protein [Telluria sp.]